MAGIDTRTKRIVDITTRRRSSDGRDEMLANSVSDTVLFVYKGFEVMTSSDIAKRCALALKKGITQIPKTVLVEGVPGAGKTWYILENFKPEDLVLCACRETADSIRRSLVKRHGMLVAKRVKTIDSYLMNGDATATVLWIDEALMVHAGVVEVATQKAKAEKRLLFGDTKQLRFINRLPLTRVHHAYLKDFDVVEHMWRSKRCPADAIAAVLDIYDGKIRTDSSVVQSIKLLRLSSVQALPWVEGVQYLCFSQGEKEDLRKLGFKGAITIHEAQGETYREVILFRGQPMRAELYDSEPHAVVALTRHTHKFTYATVSQLDDRVVSLIRLSTSPSRRAVAVSKD